MGGGCLAFALLLFIKLNIGDIYALLFVGFIKVKIFNFKSLSIPIAVLPKICRISQLLDQPCEGIFSCLSLWVCSSAPLSFVWLPASWPCWNVSNKPSRSECVNRTRAISPGLPVLSSESELRDPLPSTAQRERQITWVTQRTPSRGPTWPTYRSLHPQVRDRSCWTGNKPPPPVAQPSTKPGAAGRTLYRNHPLNVSLALFLSFLTLLSPYKCQRRDQSESAAQAGDAGKHPLQGKIQSEVTTQPALPLWKRTAGRPNALAAG